MRRGEADKAPDAAPRGWGSLTVRLAVVVVLTVLAVVGAGAAVDYHREYRVHFERVFASLEEQAKALQVTRGRIHGDQAFARYVNDLCAQMNEFVSPGHHILIMDAEGNVIASTRHHSGAEVERALLEAPPSARVLTVGDHRLAQIRVRDEDGATIVLAQYLDRVERILRGQLVRSALIAAVTSAALIGLIFLAIHVWVLKPFGGLHEASRAWAARDFTARAPKSGTTDLRALADQFNRMAAQLETHQRQQRAELQRARAIQHALLPQRLPDVAGVTFAAAYHPAEYVAGDLYDVWSLPDGRTAVVILDVSGHGIAAALLTGAVKISLHRRLEICEGPGDALRLVNGDLLAWVPEDRFVTACAGVWDTRSQTWTYASAAHPGGLLVSDRQVKALTSTGPPLGIQAEVTWDEQRVALGPGDRLLLYTDGVTDAGHPGKTLGEDGLRRIVHHTSGEDVDRQVEAVTREVLARSRTGLADDATLLAFRVQRAT